MAGGFTSPSHLLRWILFESSPTSKILAVSLAGVFCWAYWPTLLGLATSWSTEPDYSHGFFVVPLALLFLWLRRQRFPGTTGGWVWVGWVFIALSVAVRYVGGRYHVDALDGWSIPIWILGTCWLIGGWQVCLWAGPSIAFLWLMTPLPYRAERLASLPLQRIATSISCWGLQFLGQPALAEGNTIYLGEHPLEVEDACCGLRIFVGVFALASAYVIIVRRSLWEKAVLFACVVPVALAANAVRIVMTALLYQHVSGPTAKQFSHDYAGWVMIFFAAALFGLVLWYLSRLFKEMVPGDVGSLIRQRSG